MIPSGRVLFITLFLFFCSIAGAQEFAIKTNLLYDATTTPNIGGEISVGKRSTISLVYGLNPWTFGKDSEKGRRRLRHWVIQPEYRWWTCTQFDGHFIGIHLLGGQMNAENVSIPFPGFFFGGDNIMAGLRHHRYEGWFAGGGFTYGYQWIIGKHWNVEAEIGAGYNYVNYKKFKCADCAGKIGQGHSNYMGITKLGLSILYLF